MTLNKHWITNKILKGRTLSPAFYILLIRALCQLVLIIHFEPFMQNQNNEWSVSCRYLQLVGGNGFFFDLISDIHA